MAIKRKVALRPEEAIHWPRPCKVRLRKVYVGWAIFVFAVEVLIAFFVRDRLVRPYLGDLLVVILIYCSVRGFIQWPVVPVAIGVLLFSFAIELLQYVHLVEILGLEKSALARTVIGTSFAWADLAAYTAGMIIVVAVEKGWKRRWS